MRSSRIRSVHRIPVNALNSHFITFEQARPYFNIFCIPRFKMKFSLKSCLAIVLIGSFFNSVFAIHCYHCDSITNSKCGEHFEAVDNIKIDCARVTPPRFLDQIFAVRNATGCMKKMIDSDARHPQMLRTCYFGDISNTQTGCMGDPSLPFVKQLACEVCSSNLCNGSNSVVPIASAITWFFTVAYMMS